MPPSQRSKPTLKRAKAKPACPPPYYPAYLDLRKRKCVVVGGGPVATRKALSLLKAGASVTIISPAISPRLASLLKAGKLRHLNRTLRPSDLKAAFLTIAATDSSKANALAARHATGLVNVADSPEQGNFIVPSTISRGPLCIAISTSGTSPALARNIRVELEKLFPKELGQKLAELYAERQRILGEVEEPARRRRMLKGLASKGAAKRKGPGR